jgi:hypothetical protein
MMSINIAWQLTLEDLTHNDIELSSGVLSREFNDAINIIFLEGWFHLRKRQMQQSQQTNNSTNEIEVPLRMAIWHMRWPMQTNSKEIEVFLDDDNMTAEFS